MDFWVGVSGVRTRKPAAASNGSVLEALIEAQPDNNAESSNKPVRKILKEDFILEEEKENPSGATRLPPRTKEEPIRPC